MVCRTQTANVYYYMYLFVYDFSVLFSWKKSFFTLSVVSSSSEEYRALNKRIGDLVTHPPPT